MTDWPFASWCLACVASRSKEDKRERADNKEDVGKNIFQIDFCYTYTVEEDRTEKPVQDKVVERQDQYGAVRPRPFALYLFHPRVQQASRPSVRRLSALPWRTRQEMRAFDWLQSCQHQRSAVDTGVPCCCLALPLAMLPTQALMHLPPVAVTVCPSSPQSLVATSSQGRVSPLILRNSSAPPRWQAVALVQHAS